jgi:hypothetical protein
MRHSLPSTRFRRLRVLTLLAALVALASIGLSAHAGTPPPAQAAAPVAGGA